MMLQNYLIMAYSKILQLKKVYFLKLSLLSLKKQERRGTQKTFMRMVGQWPSPEAATCGGAGLRALEGDEVAQLLKSSDIIPDCHIGITRVCR